MTRAVTVTNQLGLHARAAARFVHLAAKYESQIRVGRDAKVMDGKSIMAMLLLAAARGTTMTISAEGPDEAAAIYKIVTSRGQGVLVTANGGTGALYPSWGTRP